MVFYHNTSFDSEQELSTYLTQDTAYLLVSELEYLLKMDFLNFNYFNFEQDVSDLSEDEFNMWWESSFKNWLIELDENYLDINFEELLEKFETTEEKRIFLLRLVNFVMYLLPYEVLRPIFKEEDISTTAELNEYLNDDYFLITLRDLIIEQLEKHKKDTDNFIYALTQLGKVAKKNLVDEDIQPLRDHIEKQNFFIDIFIRLIEETDMEKIKNLIQQVEQTDSKNLL